MWVEIVKLHQTPPTFCIITLKRTILEVGMIVSVCMYVICNVCLARLTQIYALSVVHQSI